MNTENVVKLMIDNLEVEGTVTHLSASDFDVQIIKPFKNISGGSHIPYFARPHYSFEGEYGKKRILETLRDLYVLGKYLSEEMASLKKKLDSLEDESHLQMNSFFDDNFPLVVPVGTREEVVDILKGKKNLSG